MVSPRTRFEALAAILDTLASPVRLEILHAARAPRVVSELRIIAARTREGESADRTLSRQTVAHHADQLLASGLLVPTPTADGREAVVVDHARLFALVDEMRALSKLQPIHPTGGRATIEHDEPSARPLPAKPRLLLAYGRDDAIAFALHGEVGSTWRMGRSDPCEIRLDYDPYASAQNAILERTPAGFTITDQGSRNGTWVDWKPLRARVPERLLPGSLILAGRSLLVFQA